MCTFGIPVEVGQWMPCVCVCENQTKHLPNIPFWIILAQDHLKMWVDPAPGSLSTDELWVDGAGRLRISMLLAPVIINRWIQKKYYVRIGLGAFRVAFSSVSLRDPVVPNLRYGDVFDTLMQVPCSGPVIPNLRNGTTGSLGLRWLAIHFVCGDMTRGQFGRRAPGCSSLETRLDLISV